MQSKPEIKCSAEPPAYLYEYAVVRFVPDVEREEFVNIGLIMMCKRARWIRSRFHIDEKRILSLFPSADIECLRQQIVGFERVADADRNGGPIAEFETHERFRWLTAVRSACLQTSRPHAGRTDNIDVTFDNLFQSLIC